MDRSFLLDVSTVLPAGKTAKPPKADVPTSAGDGVGRHPAAAPEPPSAPVVTMTGVRTGTDPLTGKPFLHIVARDENGKLLAPFILDDWLRYGDIGLAFAEALYGMGLKPSSLDSKIRDLRVFFGWLPSEFPGGPPTRLSDLTTERLLRFRSHLDASKDDNGRPLADNSKRKRLGEVRTVFTWMQKKSPNRWKPKLAPKLRFPEGVWKGTGKRTEPRDIVPRDGLHAILKAAAAEVERTIRLLDEGAELVAAGQPRLRAPDEMNRRSDFDDLAVALAAVVEWHGGYLQNIEEAKAKHSALGNSIQYVHGATNVFRRLYPGGRELVPFIILLTVHTAYNPDTILGLRLNQIEMNDVFPDQFGFALPKRHNSRGASAGEQADEADETATRIRTKGRKGRARGRPQNRSFRADPDDLFGSYLLIQNVKAMTERLRPHAAPVDRDRLFIFHQTQTDIGVRSFGNDKETIAADRLWQYFLKRFIADNDLPDFSLASLRATMADAAEQLTGDIRAVQLLLGHSGTDVTFQHYLSAGARRRAAEAVGTVQGMRQRWVETGGKRDAREPGVGDTLMAATPGFHCLDPYDSPVPGQVAGKMCSAWLACAFCALATVHADDGYGLARLIQLEKHILDARRTIAAERYQTAYVPLLAKLSGWLGKFSDTARAAAVAVTHLKPLPELE
ncbi:MAG TPA: hypothetical protein VGE72_17900 [Azospirillum sp.]